MRALGIYQRELDERHHQDVLSLRARARVCSCVYVCVLRRRNARVSISADDAAVEGRAFRERAAPKRRRRRRRWKKESSAELQGRVH